MAARTLSLSFKGRFLSNNEQSKGTEKEQFDWKNALADAAVSTGWTFGVGFLAILSDGIFTMTELYWLCGLCIVQFFSWLGIKRGIAKPEIPKP